MKKPISAFFLLLIASAPTLHTSTKKIDRKKERIKNNMDIFGSTESVFVNTVENRKQQDRIESWKASLESLLRDHIGSCLFQAFLDDEYSSENLHFLLDTVLFYLNVTNVPSQIFLSAPTNLSSTTTCVQLKSPNWQ